MIHPPGSSLLAISALAFSLGSLVSASTADARRASLAFPRVRLAYAGPVDDYWCPDEWKSLITPQWRTEADAKIGSFTAAWQAVGGALFKRTVREPRRAFSRREIEAAWFLCPGLPDTSIPFTLNFSMYLQAAADAHGLEAPESKDLFIDTLFHEPLHPYVAELLAARYPDGESPLLRRWRREEASYVEARAIRDLDLENFLAHLHLFAIQTAVYSDPVIRRAIRRASGQAEMLGEVIKQSRAMERPEYAEAWRVVNEVGAEPFLNEIRAR